MTLFLPRFGNFKMTNEEAEEVKEFVDEILNPLEEEYGTSTAEIIANSILDDSDIAEEYDAGEYST